MKPIDAFVLMDDEYGGNYLTMPYDIKLECRKAMRECVRDRKHMLDALRNLCKLDLFFLCHSVLGFVDTKVEVHRPFCDNIESNPLGSINMMPRGYFKSTVGTIGRSTQLLLNDPDRRILLANATATLSEKFVGKIRSFFSSNKMIRELFPELIPPNFKKVKWADTGFEINRPTKHVECSVEAIGVSGTRVGHHYTDIIFDDLVDEDEIASIGQMDKVIEWLKLVYGSLGVKGEFNSIYNATRWAYYDAMSWCIENLPDLPVFNLSCFDKNGESTFPEVYTTERLKELEEIKGTMTFSAQFLNDPLPAGTQLIKPDWIQWYDVLPDRPMRKYMLVDPAIAENKLACKRAIIIVGVDENYNWYVVDYYEGRHTLWDPKEVSLIGEMFRLYTAYKPQFVGVEDIGFQAAMIFLVQRLMEDKKLWFGITSMKPVRNESKDMRIEGLAAPFGARKVYLQNKMKNGELYKELVGYPAYRWRDLVDAFSYLLQYAWPDAPNVAPVLIKPNTLKDVMNRIDEKRESNLSAFVFDFGKPKIDERNFGGYWK